MSIANYIYWNGLDMEIYSHPKVRDFIGMPPVPEPGSSISRSDLESPSSSTPSTAEIREPQLSPEIREPSVQEVPEVPTLPIADIAPTLAQATTTIQSFHRPHPSDPSPSTDSALRTPNSALRTPHSERRTPPRSPYTKEEQARRMAEIDRLREENRRLHPEDYIPPHLRPPPT